MPNKILHGMDALAGEGNRKCYPENPCAALVIIGLGCSDAGGRSMGGEKDVWFYARYLQRYTIARLVT